MSDLSATNCGCDCGREVDSCGNNSCIWIILLLLFCGGCGNGRNSWGNNGCDNSCLWIIILLFCCGGCGGNSFGGCC